MSERRKFIVEPARKLPVSGAYDTVVVGGGIAGVAAALAAARNGASVCLIEKENGLGGLATLGNVVYYLPLCDGMGNKVIGGISEELLKLSITDGYDKIPACWTKKSTVQARAKDRYRVKFNPMTFMLEMERLVSEHNIKLYYDTRFCDTVMRDGRIEGVIVENKSGRSVIMSGAVVDASGDADVCFQAGEKTVSSDSNVPAGWFYYFDGKKPCLECFTRPYDAQRKKLPGEIHLAGDNADSVTKFTLEHRKILRAKLAELKKKNSAVEPLFMTSLPCFRMTRRLKGAVELEESHDRKYFDDTVCMTGDWRNAGPVLYVPLRSLIASKTKNLISAGRCISANSAWDITRAIPTCAVTGEAAGAAAALLAREKTASFAALDISKLQSLLKKQYNIIDRKFAV
jgi:hypothetical protein